MNNVYLRCFRKNRFKSEYFNIKLGKIEKKNSSKSRFLSWLRSIQPCLKKTLKMLCDKPF